MAVLDRTDAPAGAIPPDDVIDAARSGAQGVFDHVAETGREVTFQGDDRRGRIENLNYNRGKPGTGIVTGAPLSRSTAYDEHLHPTNPGVCLFPCLSS
jgi:hypothetical protein